MTGKSLRKAFRKLFRLRKSNSESRLNTQGTINWNAANPSGPRGSVPDHRVVDRTRSQGTIFHTQIHFKQ